MRNKDVADILTRLGKLLEVQGENPFKIRAYYKAAENLETLSEDIHEIRKSGRLCEIPGIGKAIEEKIGQFLDTGKINAYEDVIKDVPESVLEVMEIPSVGPKKAKLFFDQLNVKNVDDLARAVSDGKLVGLPGIQEKTIEKVREGIEVVRQGQQRMNISTADEIAQSFIEALRKLPEVKAIEAAGSLRRGRETIRDIDILVESAKPQKVMEVFVKQPQVRTINGQGDTKASVMTRENVQVDLRVVEPGTFGAALLYFTGSKNFNIKLRQIAQKKDMKVSEYGVFAVTGEKEKLIAAKTEEECLKALDLPYIPPQLREDIAGNRLWEEKIPKLVELKDIRGEFHVHSTYSDGRNSIAEMTEEAQKRGYEYLAVSDHSYGLRIARGVSIDDLQKKRAEIDRLNHGFKNFKILMGSEVEIDSEGNLDYNADVLKDLDFVVAAVHSGFEQSKDQLTRRIIKACQSPYVNAIAHPTGIHLGKRKGYEIDFKEVCRAAADTNTYLEINAFPIRLDLDSSNVYFARSLGVRFVINTDAHAREHMRFMKYGVGVAQRGWLTGEDVINTRTLKELATVLKRK